VSQSIGSIPPSLKKMRQKFRRAMRLNTHDVSNVLKRGKRVRPEPTSDIDKANATARPTTHCIEARVITRSPEAMSLHREEASRAASSGARLAVAVPKRLLKKAVERNLVKRWMREALRQHPARKTSADVLFTLTAKVNLKIAGERGRVRQQINDLLASVDDLSGKRKSSARN
jgi:ribonuclease P protein component